MIKVLELFSGTGSVGKVCSQLGWESVSVDLILPADHQVNIMDFDYKQYPKDHFDIIWGSPPCQSYSRLQNCWKGRMRNGKVFTQDDIDNMMGEGDKLVLKTFEIIDWGYEKKTRIWTNKKDWNNLICDKTGKCGNMMGSQHNKVLGNGYEMIDGKKVLCNTKELRKKHRVNLSKDVGCGSQKNQPKDLKYLGKGTNRIDRYRVPEDLIFSLFQET